MHLLQAISYIVGICMGPVNAFIMDRWGRKWCIRLYGCTCIIGAILGCLAGLPSVNGFAMFVVSKGVIGAGKFVFPRAHVQRNIALLQAVACEGGSFGQRSLTRVPSQQV